MFFYTLRAIPSDRGPGVLGPRFEGPGSGVGGSGVQWVQGLRVRGPVGAVSGGSRVCGNGLEVGA